jgi:MGT family glycosyltransferase
LKFETSLGHRRNVVFFPEASFGAALNCITLAQALRGQGVLCRFITREGFAGVFRDYGFEEHVLPPTLASDSGYWAEFLERKVPIFDAPPMTQLENLVEPTYRAALSEVVATEAYLKAALDLLQPDLIVIDDVIMYPAIMTHGAPWVRVMSTGENEIPGAGVPPPMSGLGKGKPFAPFAEAANRILGPVHGDYMAFRADVGVPALPPSVFIDESPYLNLVIAPSPLRIDRDVPLPADRFLIMEHNVRTEPPFAVPDLPRNEGPLVYVSFGSLGALDTGFMRRLISVFADVPARFLVNVGARLDAYSKVPDNVHLQSWFPQPSVVAHCDLFIHHGGLSSTCEALLNGAPSLVLPYFWDGHDTARRIEEAGLGRALSRSELEIEHLGTAIADLLADPYLKDRLSITAARIRQGPATAEATARILALLALSKDSPKPVATTTAPHHQTRSFS